MQLKIEMTEMKQREMMEKSRQSVPERRELAVGFLYQTIPFVIYPFLLEYSVRNRRDRQYGAIEAEYSYEPSEMQQHGADDLG